MKTTIIADACSNHLNNIFVIRRMVEIADEVGIDYIKFQLYNTSKLSQRFPNYQENFQYYRSLELSKESIDEIKNMCKYLKVKPLFTLFDKDKYKTILDTGIVKVGSEEAHKVDWIKDLATKFKTVIVSLGMADYKIYKELRNIPNVKLLYCVSNYPTKEEEIDFDAMKFLDGFSDHTLNLDSSKKAIDLGMEYVERHFTLGKDLPGRDHHISSLPSEFEELVRYRDSKEKHNTFKMRWVD